MSNTILCPSCGSDNCQSFTILNAHGTSLVNTTTRTAGIGVARGGIGVGTAKSRTTGTQQTAVGAMTAPPAKKRLKWQIVFTVFFGFIGLIGLANHGEGIISLIIGLAFAYWWYTKVRYNKNVWPNLYNEWSSKFLCNKCGTVFKGWQNEYDVASTQVEVAATVE